MSTLVSAYLPKPQPPCALTMHVVHACAKAGGSCAPQPFVFISLGRRVQLCVPFLPPKACVIVGVSGFTPCAAECAARAVTIEDVEERATAFLRAPADAPHRLPVRLVPPAGGPQWPGTLRVFTSRAAFDKHCDMYARDITGARVLVRPAPSSSTRPDQTPQRSNLHPSHTLPPADAARRMTPVQNHA